MQDTIEFIVPKSLQNNMQSYEFLINLYGELCNHYDNQVSIQMKNTQFVAANLFSLFGCILHDLHMKNHHNLPSII